MTSYEIHFCKECNNLNSISMNEENILIYDCKYCGKQEKIEGIEGKCIYSSFSRGIDKSTLITENKYIHHDITLPNIKNNENIKCPNEQCGSQKEGSSIKYIKYDNDELKFMYICNICGYKWKNSK